LSKNGEIQNVAVVGTGVIGASWAAYYVDEAWKTLSNNGLSTSASRDRLTFEPSMAQALAKADFVQENAPERPDFKARCFA
jgi:carnitine 3-dehydrogenase